MVEELDVLRKRVKVLEREKYILRDTAWKMPLKQNEKDFMFCEVGAGRRWRIDGVVKLAIEFYSRLEYTIGQKGADRDAEYKTHFRLAKLQRGSA